MLHVLCTHAGHTLTHTHTDAYTHAPSDPATWKYLGISWLNADGEEQMSRDCFTPDEAQKVYLYMCIYVYVPIYIYIYIYIRANVPGLLHR